MAIKNGTSAADVLSGTNKSDTLNGKDGNDYLNGLDGADNLNGGNHDDFLSGGRGNDRLNGGSGNDTYDIYSDSGNDTFVEAAGGGFDVVNSFITFSLAASPDRANLEGLILLGTGNINGTGNAQHNHLIGNSGKNILTGLDGNDTFEGGGGNDTTVGGKGNDLHIVAQIGDKVKEVASGGGIDTLGSSTISVNLNNTVNVENGRLTGALNLNLTGDAEVNSLFGNNGNNTLNGGGGNDILRGGIGGDRLIGGTGADSLFGDDGNDTLVWHSTIDLKLDGGGGDDTLEVQGSTDLNLTAIPNSLIVKVEGLDLLGANTVTLASSDVLAMSPTGTLFITGTDAADIVSTQFWTFIGHVPVDDFTVGMYRNGTAEIHVQTDINRTSLATFNLGALNGNNGFTLLGATGDGAGGSVALGDVNGDGFLDIITGAQYATPGGNTDAGAVHVVFGGTRSVLDAAHGASGISLSGMPSTVGVTFNGVAEGDLAGISVASGDFNGDGFGDVLVGAQGANPSGAGYMVFGGETPAGMSFSGLDGGNGVLFRGVGDNDFVGTSVAAGDFNGDGIADAIIGAPGASLNGIGAGMIHGVFGSFGTGFDALHGASGFGLTGLDGANGFQVHGGGIGDLAGQFTAAGDLNGDGISDLIVGSNGDAAVVFGGPGSYLDTLHGTSGFDLANLDGLNGFLLNRDPAFSGGVRVAAGDVNGDGQADMIFTMGSADTAPGGVGVIYGGDSSHWDALHGESGINISALNGSNGFFAYDAQMGGNGGLFVAAGDVNGDGRDDIVVGVPNHASDAGKINVIYGGDNEHLSGLHNQSGLGGVLDGFFGFSAIGAAGSRSGVSVAVGDVDGDGFADIVSGGAAFVGVGPGSVSALFGGNFNNAVDFLGGTGNDSMTTGTTGAEVYVAGIGNDSADGGGGADSFRMGVGTDWVFADGDFRLIDGGAGFDSWAVTGEGATLTGASAGTVLGIEAIFLSYSANASLTVDLQNLLDMSRGSSSLTIEGLMTNMVTVTDGEWAMETVGDYDVFTTSSIANWSLRIDSDINWDVPLD